MKKKKKSDVSVYEVKNLTKAERIGLMTLCDKHAKDLEHVLKKEHTDSIVLAPVCFSLAECTRCRKDKMIREISNKEISRICVIIPGQITMVFNRYGWQIPEFQAPGLLLKDKILSALEGHNAKDITFEIANISMPGKEPQKGSQGLKTISFEEFKTLEPEEEGK